MKYFAAAAVLGLGASALLAGHLLSAQPPKTDFSKADLLKTDLCAANLKQIAVAVSGYTQDFDGALPPMQAAQAALAPYSASKSFLDCPVTKKPYQPNAALSAKVLAKLPCPNTQYLFRDSVAHPDGRLTYLYADGHIAHLAQKGPKK